MDTVDNTIVIKTLANTVRLLAADTVQKAKSGHPGMPMGTAEIASTLWTSHLNFNPQDPKWINRDRFVLSAGHGSTLLYSLLYLFGYDVTMDDLKKFRQWGSRTPGHPEYGYLPGIECTTGPLGQGIAMATGMALAMKMAKERFNTKEFEVINNNIYALAGDGCIMEGVAAEASSLAGHLKLDNLIVFYDCNNITIEGNTDLAFSENVAKRYESYGWKVFLVDGHDVSQICKVIKEAKEYEGAPKLIICKTHIACSAPTLQDKSASHGSPLGEEEIRNTKKILGFPENESFYIPKEVVSLCKKAVEKKCFIYSEWQELFKNWQKNYPEKNEELATYIKKPLPVSLTSDLIDALPEKDEATRVSSGNAIQKIAKYVPFTVGGSADLEPSVKCHIKASSSIKPDDYSGRNLHFGIREHAMGAIANGMALSGLFIPHCATFLVFSDYMKGAIRLSAIMGLQTIYVFTHDSIFLGEDGPTHQPIEHLGALRIIPNLTVIRPADAFETSASWLMALQNKKRPTALILSRHNLPQLHKNVNPVTDISNLSNVLCGGYILEDCKKSVPDVVITASGSEVHLAVSARNILLESNIDARVVSMPSLEIFMSQDADYREKTLPSNVKIIAIEAANTRDWDRFTANGGLFIGLDSFGHSAPTEVLADKYGFTGEQIAAQIKKHLGK